jgi:uncharacterized protein (TIGR02646 family)
MKHIHKGTQPPSLLKYRKQFDATYENYREKDELREALLKEQGYICCYCMRRITEGHTKIEHWKPQTKYPALQLDYHNLLAACNGNEGEPKELQHCDTQKGDAEIVIHPADSQKNCEDFIKYRNNGEIYSDDPEINQDLNDTLNLNLQALVENRKRTYKGVIGEITRIRGGNVAWSVTDVKKNIRDYENKGSDGKYKPYCNMVVYLLKKRFAKELNSSLTRN